MDMTLLEHEISKFIHGEAFHIVGSGLWTLCVITLNVYEFEYGIFLNYSYVS
jgi:hypothetical protein